MAESSSNLTILHADPEHGALRTSVILILALCLWLSFILIRALINRFAPASVVDFSFILSCTAAIPFALAIAWAIEELLKRFWHSGNKVTLSAETMTFEQQASIGVPNPKPQTFDRTQRINFTNWTFPLKGYPRYGREKRVSDKWICLATEIQQDDNRALVYSYMPPKQAAQWLDMASAEAPFHSLPIPELYEEAGKSRAASRPDIPTSLLHDKEARYWLAEQRRWKRGVELTPHDFNTLMTFLQANL